MLGKYWTEYDRNISVYVVIRQEADCNQLECTSNAANRPTKWECNKFNLNILFLSDLSSENFKIVFQKVTISCKLRKVQEQITLINLYKQQRC